MKTRIVRIIALLTMLTAVAWVALWINRALPGSEDLAVKEPKGLARGETISVKTRAGRFGVQLGDVFTYQVQVWYNPLQVPSIDRTSLDKGMNVDPFEIRGMKEIEYDYDATTRVYQRDYELQLLTGQVGQFFKLPSLVVRYNLKGSEGLLDKTVTPEPVYIASRLPADIASLDLGSGEGYGPLRPVKSDIQDLGQNRLPWIFYGIGGLFAVLGIVDLSFRVVPRWRELAQQKSQGDALSQAYRSLGDNLTGGADPRQILHQTDHLLRVLLYRHNHADWLAEVDLDELPEEIRENVRSLLEHCQKAYEPGTVEPHEAEQAVRQLDGILDALLGPGVRAAWRN